MRRLDGLIATLAWIIAAAKGYLCELIKIVAIKKAGEADKQFPEGAKYICG
jgi:hypothetical protein